ncbi:MAG TPA: hypothetical protein VJV78_34680 [Polyangiales bacterium]|nr:hypothetical protein [Polyangiales bacterium]
MRTRTWLCILLLSASGAACSLTMTEALSGTELETTERGGFTADGSFFLIGTRPAGRADTGSWIVQVTKLTKGGYVGNNYVAGTLEGTEDGTLKGKPLGDACVFSGMAVHGSTLYAACFALDFRVSLLEVDTQAGTVRAGYFSSCNAQPSTQPCEGLVFYPNGMGTDATGRVYASNTIAYWSLEDPENPVLQVEGSRSISQIVIDHDASSGNKLVFTHHDWFTSNIVADGVAPNGIQIEGQTLYYAAGANINRVQIREDGSAGDFGLHYAGPPLSYIDDFAVRDGRMALARTLPPAIVGLERAPRFGLAREVGTWPMGLDQIPSSVSYQADIPAGASLFPADSLVITCFFGGGLHVLANAP